MKLKVHPYLSSLLSKHFISHILPKLVFPISSPFDVSRKTFIKYWTSELSTFHKKQALCFFMDEIVEMVNKTNSRLLYDDLIKNIKNKNKQAITQTDDDQYQLLNVFEMLWNVNDNEVQIEDSGEKTAKSIKGHALTVKEEYLETNSQTKNSLLIQICENVRVNSKCSFLESTIEGKNKQNIIFPLQG